MNCIKFNKPILVSVVQKSEAECGHDGCREQYETCEMPRCIFTAYYKCMVRPDMDNLSEEICLNICDVHFKDITVDTSQMKNWY